MSKKIEQVELEELVKQQSLKSRMLTDIGTLEVQKTQILGSFAQLLADAEKTSKDLEKKYAFVGIILGLPINMNGTEGPRCQSTRSFATKLSQMTNHFICLWDERLSTLAAEKSLISSDISRKSRTKIIDKIAASYILQGFLDRLKNS